jgi:hypothetical protein
VMRGLDRWIEGDYDDYQCSSEWRSKRPEPPQPAGERGPSLLKPLADEYADLTPTELLARLRAMLGGGK